MIRARGDQQIGLVVLIIAVLLLVLDTANVLEPLRVATDTLTGQLRTSAVGVRQTIAPFVDFAAIPRNEQLIADIEQVTARQASEHVELERLREENRKLRQQLEAPFAPDTPMLPAHIIGVGGQTAILDIGSDQGVAAGDAVVSEKNLLGVVSATTAQTATVQLLTHPESKTPAETIPDRGRGLLVASGDRLELTQILQKTTVEVGDVVVTSGLNRIPRDLVIGEVTEVAFVESDLFKTARVTPILSVDDLVTVFVMVHGKSQKLPV